MVFFLNNININTESFKYFKILYNIMGTSQINLRFSDELLLNAKNYAQNHGYLNLQEFIREAVREKVYDDRDIRGDYIEKLNTKDATTFISDSEADELDKELEIRANLE